MEKIPSAAGTVSWLLHLVVVSACLTASEKNVSIRIVGFHVYPRRKKTAKAAAAKPEVPKAEVSKPEIPEPEVSKPEIPKPTAASPQQVLPEKDRPGEGMQVYEPREELHGKETRSEAKKEKRQKTASEQQKAGREKKTHEKKEGDSLASKVKGWKELLLSEEMKAAFAKVKRKLFALMRHILPRKLTGYLHFGFSDPSLTGRVLAGLAMLYPFTKGDLHVEPEFSCQILEGRIAFRGRIHLGYLAYLALSIVLDHNIRRQLKRLKEGGKADGQASK